VLVLASSTTSLSLLERERAVGTVRLSGKRDRVGVVTVVRAVVGAVSPSFVVLSRQPESALSLERDKE